ncbi:MAG: hypothetical protein IPG39_16300 [Bacteroidetes bacterium]|nr:hypothetical protein [Bacteroidota bacterium]
MEIKLNNNDTVLLVGAAAGLLAFFLPRINLGIFGQPSGYDLFAYGHKWVKTTLGSCSCYRAHFYLFHYVVWV